MPNATCWMAHFLRTKAVWRDIGSAARVRAQSSKPSSRFPSRSGIGLYYCVLSAMMRSFAFLGLCAALPASSVSDSNVRNAKEATLSRSLNAVSTPSNRRSLQEGAEGIFRATWGTDHTGSCALASVPVATMTCNNGAEIALVDETE